MSKICVLIVTYNGSKWIRGNLTSLRHSSTKPYIIIVDNASSDDTIQIIETEFPEAELIKLSRNVGFGVGNNIGIARAIQLKMDFIFLLNQDAYVTETTIEELSIFLEDNENFGVVTPLHCSPNLQTIDNKTARGYLQSYACQFLLDACTGRARPCYQIKGINAAAWFVRTSVFLKVGGFDPVFFMYGEDDDLINRINFHHILFALLPQSKIVHLREKTSIPPLSYWNQVLKEAKITRSSLIAQIKNPSFSKVHMALHILAKGILVPLASFLIERNHKELLGSFVASVQINCEISRIQRHARLCATPGPHFLMNRE